MFEVAKLAGVSHQTVSRVINHSPDVSAKTREKVQRAIDELGYLPSNSARALASSRSRTIGLIAGGNRFYGPVSTMASIEEAARRHGLFTSVMLLQGAACTQEEFNGMCRTFEEQNVDAFIVNAPTDMMFEAALRAPVRQPRVLITSTHGAMSVAEGLRMLSSAKRQTVSIVGNDQWGGMESVAQVVTEYGHKNVLYFAGPRDWRDAMTRLLAWNRSCADLGVNSVTVQCASWDAGEAYRRMNHVLENIGRTGVRPPSCVVCANDNMAVGVMRALHEHGVLIPQDMSVVGFDDLAAMDNMTPPLSTVHPNFDDLGTVAMREVLYLLGEGKENAFAISNHGVGLIPCEFIRRRSLGPADIA